MAVFPGTGFLQLTMIRSDDLDLASLPIFNAPSEQHPSHPRTLDPDEPAGERP